VACQIAPFDILVFGLGWWGSDATRSDKTPRVHHAARRRGGEWPLSARAQQAMPVIGVLGGHTRAKWQPFVTAFHQGLKYRGAVDIRKEANRRKGRFAQNRPRRRDEEAWRRNKMP
jgi:hypothetical protein